jgi:hypothetical protein
MAYVREDSFEYQVKEIVKEFIEEWGLSKKNCENVTDKIWEEKESFGKIAFERMVSYFGDEIFFETFEEEAPALTEDEELEEKEDDEDEE